MTDVLVLNQLDHDGTNGTSFGGATQPQSSPKHGGEQGAERAKEKRRAGARGKRYQREIARLFEARGCRVEVARNVVVRGRQGRTMTVRHDIFHCWDMVCVTPDGGRFFVQVSTLHNLGAKRTKILREHRFPATRDDIIAVREEGRRRLYRLYRGPDFTEWESVEAPPERAKKARKEPLVWCRSRGCAHS